MNILLIPVLLLSSAAPHAADLERSLVAEGLRHPWSMAFVSASEALVTEKDGYLQRLDLGSGQFRKVDGIPSDLDNVRGDDPRDNSGLFDVVLHPRFPRDRRIFLSYASKGTGGATTKVISGQYDGTRLQGVKTLLEATPRTGDRFHYGGGMVFGPDGHLYVTVGERLFHESDEPALPIAQDPSDRRGKIYRIKADGTAPADNPRFGAGAPKGLFALGIRASQGIALQPGTGTIWFSEHGSQQGDELNILKPGANYGWPILTTGRYRDADYSPPALKRDFESPVWYWTHTVAPTGLCFYTGAAHPEWAGNLFVAGLSRGSLWRFDIQNDRVVAAEELFVDERVRLRNVKQGPDGHLYLLTDERKGRVLRIQRPEPAEG